MQTSSEHAVLTRPSLLKGKLTGGGPIAKFFSEEALNLIKKNSHIKVGIYVSRWPINGGIEKLINQ